MSDLSLVLERSIDAPTDAVWRVLTDVEGSEAVLSGVTRIERLAGAGYAIGTRWRETRTMLGREATEEMEVVGIDPGRSTTIAAEVPGMRYRTEFELEPLPAVGGAAATLLRMRFSGTYVSPSWVQRLAARLTSRLGLAAARRAMQQDLDDIAAAAEAGR
ncbi:SRPBCC family protein [Agrococcus sp. HG114]|uniref:SRPBCC family protein n=1 Tax=Agrococcus sp. HG114 TaxID=2969757 RepID=UPI00215A8CE4|nr:SRPBCC family protein [Agrococcus sp. HG114]MCR8670610.1 SRPBCC family protein [Agrococcus sp. HG114]